MIPTTSDEALSVIRKWKEDKARIRLVAYSKSFCFSFDCAVISATEAEIGVQLTGQPRSVCAVRVSGCDFAFGADDVPGPEVEIGLQFDVGLTIMTPEAETILLLEVPD